MARQTRKTSKLGPGRKPKGKAPGRRILWVLSDSTGNLARHMLTAFLTQFPPDVFEVRMKTFLRTEVDVQRAMDQAVAEPGIVFHAVVSPKGKAIITDRCQQSHLPCRDLTGGFVSFLSSESGVPTQADPSRLHDLDAAYHQRIRSLEFTLEHDDGLGLDTLHEADIVLAGVSRTSKTPTSVYLAQLGYKVANVSLSIDVEPPRQLLALPPGRVVGLIIDPTQLVEIRTRRQSDWRMGIARYNDPDYVDQELAWSRRLFQHQSWPVINVTDQAIEETAGKVVQLLGLGTKPAAEGQGTSKEPGIFPV